MTLNAKAVVFDLDGTLLDTYRLIFDAFNHAWAQQGITLSDQEIEARFGPPEPELIQGVMGEAWRQGLARFHEYYQENHGRLIKLAPYWQEVLSCIKHQGYRLGLFTGKGQTATEITLSQTGLAGYFDSVLTGTEVNHPKPNPEGLIISARRFGIKPEDLIYVGDTWVDVEAAHSVGAKIALSTLYHKPDEKGLRLKPDWVLRSLEDLHSWARELPPVGGKQEIS